ncbi:interleukin-4-like [Numida meleagris]|uniref:interleukin-4-like n=1 Tax=Numida meleagris TaxID=8996 RepID=UPI000B3DEE54|nr:interleukin-4-like [Numida meleagris]
MCRTLKAALALLCLAELVASTSPPKRNLSEIIQKIQRFNQGEQIPCNDTRVAEVAFSDPKLSKHELLCQAATVLSKVTRCKENYDPIIDNLQSLHDKKSCSLSTDNEIYLRNFLPALGNYTQNLFRQIPTTTTK